MLLSSPALGEHKFHSSPFYDTLAHSFDVFSKCKIHMATKMKNCTNKQKETSTQESIKNAVKGIGKLKEISRHLTETEVLPTFEAIEESLDKRTPSAVEREKKPIRV